MRCFILARECLDALFHSCQVTDKGVTAAQKGTDLQRLPARDMDGGQLIATQRPGYFPAVHRIRLLKTFLLAGGDIRRINHYILYSHCNQFIMCPEATETGFIG